MNMTYDMKRNIQTTDGRYMRSRSGGFAIRQHRVSGFAILLLIMTVEATIA